MLSNGPILVTVTGPDRPGITAKLTGILAEIGAVLLDVEQVVVRGNLTLALLVSLPEARGGLKELLFASKELGVDLDFKVLEANVPPSTSLGRVAYVVTLIGQVLRARDLHRVAATLAEHHANIEKISRLSGEKPSSVEIEVGLAAGAESEPLKRALLSLSMQSDFDIALQRDNVFRRRKRLIVLDMDSTLIQIEVIDELARAYGVGDQVKQITERAMHGGMDYDESLRQRLALLKGMDVAVLEKIAAELPLTDGAETLMRALRRLGYRTAVISGGFSVAAEALKARLKLDHAYSNTLECHEGKLTGNVVGPIVNGQRKAELLDLIAASEGLVLDQTIAVGDGANDLLMLQRAGLGIAFRAKPTLREAADTSLSASGLDAILHLLGLSERDVQELTV